MSDENLLPNRAGQNELELLRLQRSLEAARKCDVCVGDPTVTNIANCICGGEGTSAAEKVGLRKEIFRLQEQNDALWHLIHTMNGVPSDGVDKIKR